MSCALLSESTLCPVTVDHDAFAPALVTYTYISVYIWRSNTARTSVYRVHLAELTVEGDAEQL